MPAAEKPDPSDAPLDTIRSKLRALARLRARPCLALIGPIERAVVPPLLCAVGDHQAGDIDLVIASPGGDIEAAYVIVRTLRRRFRITAAFIPLMAKSAATFLALSADELVVGELGELGPLDPQTGNSSALEPFRAVDQVADGVAQTLKRTRGALSKDRRAAGSSEAADVTGAVVRSLFSPMDPLRLAESSRLLEETEAFAERLFRRYRAELLPNGILETVSRLVHGYPCHGFPIDLEELLELGIPARAAEDGEVPILAAITTALIHAGDDVRLLELSNYRARRRREVAT